LPSATLQRDERRNVGKPLVATGKAKIMLLTLLLKIAVAVGFGLVILALL
jgi:hypothetical protein